MLQQALKQLVQFLSTPTGQWVLLGILSFIILAVVYHKKRQIQGLTVEIIPEDTWFINRDDNHRLAIVVSLHLVNKSGAPIRFRTCKLSGYSPKRPPEKLFLQGDDRSVELSYPTYSLFPCREDSEFHGQPLEYLLNPYTEQRAWIFYQSRLVTMTNMLRAPIILKAAERKRKSIHVAIPRKMEQVKLYREAAMRW